MTKFEYAATLAASLAYLLTHQQDAAGLMLFDNEIRADLPPQSHHAHLQTIVHHLQQARLDQPTGAKALLTELAGRLRHRSMVFLISDLLADPTDVIAGLQTIRHANHEVVVLHVLDHDERVFPFHDNTLFEGLEAPDLSVLVDPQSLRTGYLMALREFTGRLRAACAGSKIDYVELSTLDPLDIGLRRYLTARAHMVKART
jgi:uncharacterized protein (DUF58 family)